ncbi:MAG: dehydrogenase subunit [Steroidobacteraceae bacterium]|nr:dehydrogenase subunit [Steroidobacteraceae bacterium]
MIVDAFIVLFGVLALVFAGIVLVARQPMRAALALVAHMTSLAAIFACLDVHVIALFQVLIYVGAVMVFMVYTIMLLDDRDLAYRKRFSATLVPGVAVAVVTGLALLRVLGPAGPGAPTTTTGLGPFSFSAFSAAFMTRYWLHFELATVLLLAGIVAAWAVIREER